MTRKRYLVPLLFRIGTFLTITVLFGNLGATWTTTLRKKPLIRVFFDNSVSAAYHQSISSKSLVNGYKEIALNIKNTVDRAPMGGQVEFYSFGSEIRPIHVDLFNFELNEPTTSLSAVVRMIEDVPLNHFLAGMVLVTDGQVTMGTDPLESARDLDVPLHVVGIGNLTPMVDIHIEKVDAPVVGVRGDMVTAETFVSSIGDIEERVHVTLSRGKKLVGSKMIALSGQGSLQTVKFRFRLEEPGSDLYRVQVAALKDEINIANNRLSFTITTLKDRYRVALVTGTASPNTSFIKRILRAGDKFQIDHFINLRKGWSLPIAMFWRTNYDLVILDNAPTLAMSQRWVNDLQGKLRRYPSALAFIPGPNVVEERAQALYPLLGLQKLGTNVNRDRHYSISFSEESKRHPIFRMRRILSEYLVSGISFPPLKPHLLAEPSMSQVSALVLFETPTRDIPLFTAGSVRQYQTNKMIRTAAMTSKDLWQLHFRVMWADYRDFVEQWWKRTFNWLVLSSGEEESYFRLNKSTFQQGETIYVSGTLLDLEQVQSGDAQVSMIVREETGETKSFPLTFSNLTDRWEGSFLAGKPGTYHYVINAEHQGIPKGQKTGTFRVEESQIELNRVFLNQKLLFSLTQQTNGVFASWDDRLTIHENLDLQAQGMTVAQTFQLSHWIPLCVIVLLLLIGEWITRRLFGLQ